MEAKTAAEILGRALKDERLVALVGSYASARSKDSTGRSYEGLPTPREFVALASQQFGYISKDMSFNRACDYILERDQRTGLEEFLLRYYKVNESFAIPPAHRMLAWLPFSMYITSNYDEFIERALTREKGHPFALIDNRDLVRLRRWHVPIIKYHGCVTRPSSMVAASSDYDKLERSRGLIRHFLVASLANMNILVVGHGLGDSDLSRILNELIYELKEYTPKIYVLREPSHDDVIPGFKHPYEVITEDLTQFLNRLLHESRQSREDGISLDFDEAWLQSSFFAELKQAAVLPSETQVIDAFLKHLKDEISARDDIAAILSDASTAVANALRERPNNKALKKTWDDVEGILKNSDNPSEAEQKLSEFIDARNARRTAFKKYGANIIKANERILLYSQSQRVLQTLTGVPVNTQRKVHLFLSECRPKSPHPYQDAAAVCRELENSHFQVTVCPDVVAMNLLATNQIDRVLMGTHALYAYPNENQVHSFVNTCGSLALCIAASAFKIPVLVIGEEKKIDIVRKEDAADHLHPHQESDLLKNALGIRDLRTRRMEIGHLNIGYDLVRITEGIDIAIPDLNWGT